jgi:SAM-dependent methyltransferase
MHMDGYSFMIDAAAKFFQSVYLYGWFHHPSDRLANLELEADGVLASSHKVGLAHGGASQNYSDAGWELQAMLSANRFPQEGRVRFVTSSGYVAEAGIVDLLVERDQANASTRVQKAFFERIRAADYKRVLDLGGRDRSTTGIDYVGQHEVTLFDVVKRLLRTGRRRAEVTVFDIVGDDNVDVVGDAHELSHYFPAGHFDALHCRSVLEHTLMPWKIAVEAAKVLRPGGLGVFLTHQTTGMHDMPWDFWRFSDTCWDALFNEQTGFRILDRALGHECYVIPHRWRPDAR